MKIHEYQAKEIFRSYNVRVPAGKPAFSIAEALVAYDTLGSETVVIKAQIHAGGRGKGGGDGAGDGEASRCEDTLVGGPVDSTNSTNAPPHNGHGSTTLSLRVGGTMAS